MVSELPGDVWPSNPQAALSLIFIPAAPDMIMLAKACE